MTGQRWRCAQSEIRWLCHSCESRNPGTVASFVQATAQAWAFSRFQSKKAALYIFPGWIPRQARNDTGVDRLAAGGKEAFSLRLW